MQKDQVSLRPQGFSLDEIWNCFIEQIALFAEQAENIRTLSIEERLALQEKIQKLEKQIQKTETAAWKEQQPKKQFALYTKLREYQKQLEELKHGQA